MRRADPGFTLIETMVALVILGLSMVVLMGAVQGSLRAVQAAGSMMSATEVAASALDGLGQDGPLHPGTWRETTAEGFAVETSIRAVEGGAPGTPLLLAVTVTVRPGAAGAGGDVSVTTYRLTRGQP